MAYLNKVGRGRARTSVLAEGNLHTSASKSAAYERIAILLITDLDVNHSYTVSMTPDEARELCESLRARLEWLAESGKVIFR